MSRNIQPRLREFAKTVLERRGALVDWPETAPEGLAILPPGAAAALGGGETLRLSYQPGENCLAVNLAAEFPERLRPLLAAEPGTGLFHIPELYLKKAAMEEPVARAFTWQNARVKVTGSEPDRIEYHTWHFQAALDSYERWEELFSITVNAASGAEVILPATLGPEVMSLCGPPGPPRPRGNGDEDPGTDATFQYAARRLMINAEERAAPFISRLEAGLQRDRKRIRAYYHALLRDAKTPREREDSPLRGQEDKRRAVELELRRKTAELDERYAVKAVITPHLLVRLDMPVLAVKCEVFRRQAGRVHIIYWNPLTKALEPLRCSGCGEGIFSVYFSENDVRPLCAACFSEDS
ncbi:MAG: hypothetical protein KKH28_05905 [Elusimicrobia bacterium]|nr:hypothetical protein [Elusimicrobiota bacterium]